MACGAIPVTYILGVWPNCR